MQLALKAGAVVFATAGTPEKRELLSALGVPHVMDSRSLAFADEILELTKGEGVDLVLNSLAGDAIDKSLSILRPYGRFIEIGKTDIYKNRKIGMRPLRKNISMFVVDLLSAVEPRPELAHSLMRDVLGRFEDNELRPLPHRVFPAATSGGRISRHGAGETYRQVDHLLEGYRGAAGRAEPAEVRRDRCRRQLSDHRRSGRLGLAVADHLARRGARHLALVGRRGLSPSAQAAVESSAAERRRGDGLPGRHHRSGADAGCDRDGSARHGAVARNHACCNGVGRCADRALDRGADVEGHGAEDAWAPGICTR